MGLVNRASFFIFVFLMSTTRLHAQPPFVPNDKIVVEVSENFPSEKLPPSKFHIKKKKISIVTPVEVRDDLLRQSDLLVETKSMDHVDKDILLLRAKSLNIDELQIKYPNISLKKFKKLKSILGK